MTIRDFYKLAQSEINEGNVYVGTATAGTMIGSKALWHDGGLLSVYPTTSQAFWQAQKAPENGGCKLSKIVYQEQEAEIFIEPLLGGSRMIICGGGHVSLPVATLSAMIGFDVTVIDDRSFFANKERFPNAQVICKPFGEALPQINGNNNYYVIVTRGHQFDVECLRIILRKPSTYVGMIGSKHRVKLVREAMAEEGIAAARIEELHSPIG
ncbi:MAG: XdhC family protein, partial [Clostridiales bacterium]